MKIVKRKIKDLIRAEYNPRKLTKVQEQDLKDSLTRFGLVDPIIVNINNERKNIIIGGHQRVKVWEAMDNKEVDCIELNLTYDKERELNINAQVIDEDYVCCMEGEIENPEFCELTDAYWSVELH